MNYKTKIQLAAWTKDLFLPGRYKVVYGGRCSGKTTSMGGVLLSRAIANRLIAICVSPSFFRLQRSQRITLSRIADLHNLADKIHFEDRKGWWMKGGSRINFHNVITLKAVPATFLSIVDIIWVDDAQRLKEDDLDWLMAGSGHGDREGWELWLSFNPEYDDDPVYKTFARDRESRPAAFVHKVNFDSNPFLPCKIDEKRQQDLKHLPEAEYRHIWEGELKSDERNQSTAV